MKRKTFLKNIVLGTLSFLPPTSTLFSRPEQDDWRRKIGGMYYRRLGRTGLYISEISLGGSPLPDWSLMLRIIERGVNYIDTSCTYSNGNSERQIGRLFKEIGRDKVYVGTKVHLRSSWNEESIIQSVEGSLRRLETDYIDVLLIHGAAREEDLVDERVLKAFERLKKEGKFRFNGLSCHTNHHLVIRRAVECGHYDMVQLGYNVFDIAEAEKEVRAYEDYLGESGLRDLIRLASSKNVGVIAMKGLKVGGRRQQLDRYRTETASLIQAMLKWILENKDISSVVIEMLNQAEMEEDLAVSGEALQPAERTILYRHVAENLKDYCHLCGRCQESCPSRIPTADILRFLAYYESYLKIPFSKEAYGRLVPDQTAAACKSCAECEKACPYGVSIRSRIREAHRLLHG